MPRRRTTVLTWTACLLAVLSGLPGAAAEDRAPTLRERALAVAADDAKLRAFFSSLAKREAYGDIVKAANVVIGRRNTAVAAWEYRGFAQQRLGRDGSAWESYQRAISLDPENWWAYTQLGRLQAKGGKWRDAVQSLSRAIAIRPDSVDAHRKLVQVYRDKSRYGHAVGVAGKAIAAGLDGYWVHAELGYAHWAAQELDAAETAWKRAEELAANADEKAAAARGRAMVAFERLTPRTTIDPAELRDRRAHGPPWEFRVGTVRVVTNVGPELPEDLAAVLLERQRSHAAFYGLEGPWKSVVTLRLARTFEEHEVFRKRKLPGSWRGRAFIDDQPPQGPPGSRNGPGRRRGVPADLRLHVAYPSSTVGASISHELAHAVSRQLHNLPSPWIDEGVATYLQHDPADADDARLRKVAAALALPEARQAAAGVLPWKRMVRLPVQSYSGTTAWTRYAQAWSMVHFVMHRKAGRGAADVRSLLAGGRSWQMNEIARVLGVPEHAVEDQWRAYVKALTRRKPAKPAGSPGSSGR